MTRHARNSTAGSVYTYHEKKKDAATSGFGNLQQRLPKDSVKNFDCCSLTLQVKLPTFCFFIFLKVKFFQRCRNPVVTSTGYLFDKEAILQYIITKKGEYNRKMKEFEKQKMSDLQELQEVAEEDKKKKLDKFKLVEKNIKVASSK